MEVLRYGGFTANKQRFHNLFLCLQVTSKPLGVFMSEIKCFINLILSSDGHGHAFLQRGIMDAR